MQANPRVHPRHKQGVTFYPEVLVGYLVGNELDHDGSLERLCRINCRREFVDERLLELIATG
jgi:hypothetical protein